MSDDEFSDSGELMEMLEDSVESVQQTMSVAPIAQKASSGSQVTPLPQKATAPCPITAEISAELLIIRKAHFKSICESVYSELPPFPPNDTIEYILYIYYYSVQYVIMYNKFNGQPVPDFVNDTDADIREKAYMNHLFRCYNLFVRGVEILANNVYGLLRSQISARPESENRNVLLWFIEQLATYKELHSRRIKSDPAASRTKTDSVQKTFNIITDEEYNHENADHKSWRMLIINPLPSDIDKNAIDPKEGGITHELALMADRLCGKVTVPDPFVIVVTTEWDKVLRMLHSLLHFQTYMHTYLAGCVNLDEIAEMNIKDAWAHLFKEHKDVPIKTLSREKKKTPTIVSRTAELRDFIVCAKAFDGPL